MHHIVGDARASPVKLPIYHFGVKEGKRQHLACHTTPDLMPAERKRHTGSEYKVKPDYLFPEGNILQTFSKYSQLIASTMLFRPTRLEVTKQLPNTAEAVLESVKWGNKSHNSLGLPSYF